MYNIKTTLDLESQKFVNDHSNNLLKMFIHGNVNKKYATYAKNLLKHRLDTNFDDSVCLYQKK